MNQLLVIMINYNSSECTFECVESLKKSLNKNFHIFIIDNNSINTEKNKLKLLDEDFVTIYYAKSNLGFSGANNIGIDYAIENDYADVLLLNNDTTVPENFIDNLFKARKKYGEVVISPQIREYNNPTIISYAGGYISKIKGAVAIEGVGKNIDEIENKDKLITFAHGCCMFIPVSIIKKIGKMPEHYFLYFEDTAYSMCILNAGFKIIYLSNTYILHKECASTKKFSDNYQYYYLRNRLLFQKEYLKSLYRCIAFIYTFLFTIKALITKKFNYKNCKEAYKDYFRKKFGRRLP